MSVQLKKDSSAEVEIAVWFWLLHSQENPFHAWR
jgi:hypothetical protein